MDKHTQITAKLAEIKEQFYKGKKRSLVINQFKTK